MIRETKLARHAVAMICAIAFVIAPLMIGAAFADSSRDRARIHYNKGKELYAAGDYSGAVREFQAADRLAPNAALDYNVGLAYEGMGDKPKAVEHYRAYLDRDPNVSNRSSVEGRISTLVAAIEADASAAAAERARRAEEASKAKEAAAAAAAAEAAARKPVAPPVDDPIDEVRPADPPVDDPPYIEPSPPRPPASTGDPELDRVNGINIAQVRNDRSGSMPTASHENFGNNSSASYSPDPAAPPPADGGGKKSKPAYKQWWFWVVVGVSAIILIDIMSTDSSNAAQPGSAATVFSF